jgi:pimeloyl-ACP methyl ester carboxylesterase
MGAALNHEVSGVRRLARGHSGAWIPIFLHRRGSAGDEKYAWISSRMARINPRIESAIVPGAGHSVHAETPAGYTSLLGRFVGGLSFALGETKPVP